MFKFDLQLFAKVDNPYSMNSTDIDYKSPYYSSYIQKPLFPEDSAELDKYTKKYFVAKNDKLKSLEFWFKNNIPDINTINSLYDSISENKNYFDSKIVMSNNVKNLFSGIKFTNVSEINKILSKIFIVSDGYNAYNSVYMNNIYKGINLFETTDNKYEVSYPNDLELKPKLLNDYIFLAYTDSNYEETLLGGAFVKTINISEFRPAPQSSVEGKSVHYSIPSNPANDIVGMFKDCFAQTIIGLDEFPFEKFGSCGDYMFAGAFNLDKYIDKIADPDTKKKLKKLYYNNIEAINSANSYYDTNEVDLDKVLFEYWVKPLKLKKDSFGMSYKYNYNFNTRIRSTFEGAYIHSIDLRELDLSKYDRMPNMFNGASASSIQFKTIGSKTPANGVMPIYSNLFNLSKNGPFKLINIEGEIIFPDKDYMKPNTYNIELIESRKHADSLKGILPPKEALAPNVTFLNLKFKNYNKEALLKFIQENGRPEITTEDQLFEFFGLPKSYIQFDYDGEAHPKPVDFYTNPYSDEAVAYMKYNGIHMEEPDDFDTNVYGDASVAFRKLYNLPLPKPADYDTNPYSNEANIWAKFYNISRPSPPLIPT